MSRTTVLAVLVALLLVPLAAAQDGAAAEGKSITLKRAKPGTGDAAGQLVKSTMRSTMNMSMNGEARPTVETGRETTLRKKSEIVAADAKAVQKVKVTYMEMTTEVDVPEEFGGGGERQGRRRRGRGGEEIASDEELVGNTYVIDFSGDTPTVRDEQGAEVDSAVSSLVIRYESRDGGYGGWGPPVHEAIPEGEMKIGHRLTLNRDKVGALLDGVIGRRGNMSDVGEHASSLTLTGTTKVLGVECAVFDLKLKSSTTGNEEPPADEEGGGRRRRRPRGPSESEITGQVVVGLDDMWLYKVTLDGSMKSSMSMSRGERSFERSSESTMKIAVSSLYMKKKPAVAQ